MKKNPYRKLHLQRETLQPLGIDALALAQGGEVTAEISLSAISRQSLGFSIRSGASGAKRRLLVTFSFQ